jgi:hypothetical protein
MDETRYFEPMVPQPVSKSKRRRASTVSRAEVAVAAGKQAAATAGSVRSTPSAQSAKLYVSSLHPDFWIVSGVEAGWIMFPRKSNGWEERRAARGLDPVYLREVPLRLALETGFEERIRGSDNDKAA